MIKITSIIFGIIMALNSTSIFAGVEHDDYYAEGKKYRLVKKEADDFLSGYLNFSKNLLACKQSVFEYYNPLLNKSGKYEILGVKRDGNCLIYINYNNMREFKCNLTVNDISSIVTGRIDLIRAKSGFGELSNGESSIYFNENICERNHFKSKNKEISIEELKNNIDNPDLIEFLETYKSSGAVK